MLSRTRNCFTKLCKIIIMSSINKITDEIKVLS